MKKPAKNSFNQQQKKLRSDKKHHQYYQGKIYQGQLLNGKAKVKNLRFKTEGKKPKTDNFLVQLIWITPALVLLSLFVFYAIFIAARFSVNTAQAQHDSFEFSWIHFQNVWNNVEFQVALGNSLLYSAIVVPLSIFIALIIAKALINVMSKRMFNFLQGLFFLPYVTSGLAVAMSFAFIFSPIGAMNQFLALIGISSKPWLNDARYAIWTLIIYGIWNALPLNILLLTSALLKINDQYYQAASIDGMSRTKQFWKVTIPLIIPMIVYLITIGLIGSFKVFPLGLYPSYVDAARYRAQTIVFWIFQRREMGNLNEASACSMILMMIILLITLVTKIISIFLIKRYA